MQLDCGRPSRRLPSTIERNATRVCILCGVCFLSLLLALGTLQGLLEVVIAEQAVAPHRDDGVVASANQADDVARLSLSSSDWLWLGRLITASVTLAGGCAAASAFRCLRQSAEALRDQNQVLTQMSVQLTQTNAGLEQAVAQRTLALQSILDNTGEGVLAVGLDGSLCPEHSRVVEQWLGPVDTETKVWDYLAGGRKELSDYLYVAFDQMVTGLLPFEVAADQAPHRIERHGRPLSLEFRQILSDGEPERVLVIVRDLTAQIAAEQTEQRAREFHALVGNLLKDRTGFQKSLTECELLIDQLVAEQDPIRMRRRLHTLKGSAAVTGFQRFSLGIHELETRLQADQRLLTDDELDDLRAQWNDALMLVAEYIKPESLTSILIDVEELRGLVQSVRSGCGEQQVLSVLESWRHESVSVPFTRLAAQLQRAARLVGKQVNVQVEDGQLRVDRERFGEFWSTMVHIVCNAVDHGLEEPAVRLAAGKSEVGQITLRAEQRERQLKIKVSDDGPGIDWNEVRTLALSQGMPCHTKQDLVNALFADEFSTRTEVSELSGRGVGLSAVKAACEAAGGWLEIHSTKGFGTEVECIFELDWTPGVQSVAPEKIAGV